MKNGRKSEGENAGISTKYRIGRKGGSPTPGPQIYMFGQVPPGFECTWRDISNREDARVTYGGKVTQWNHPSKYAEWYDVNRPMPEAVDASIANALREYGVAGKSY